MNAYTTNWFCVADFAQVRVRIINTFKKEKKDFYLSVCSQSAAQEPSHCPPSWRRELDPMKTRISLQFQPFTFV